MVWRCLDEHTRRIWETDKMVHSCHGEWLADEKSGHCCFPTYSHSLISSFRLTKDRVNFLSAELGFCPTSRQVHRCGWTSLFCLNSSGFSMDWPSKIFLHVDAWQQGQAAMKRSDYCTTFDSYDLCWDVCVDICIDGANAMVNKLLKL